MQHLVERVSFGVFLGAAVLRAHLGGALVNVLAVDAQDVILDGPGVEVLDNVPALEPPANVDRLFDGRMIICDCRILLASDN